MLSAHAHTEDKPTARHMVEGDHTLGDVHRIAETQQQHGWSKLDPFSPGGNSRHGRENFKTRDVEDNMVASPDRVVAVLFGALGNL